MFFILAKSNIFFNKILKYSQKYVLENVVQEKNAIRNGFLRIEHKTANVWKSVIQTPYDASLPIRQIRDRVEDDDLWNGGILDDIGCTGMCENKDNGTYMDFGKTDEGYDINGLYKWLFKANYRTGLWEMEIFTTKSLRVPEHRRPPRRVKGRDGMALDAMRLATGQLC